MNLLVHEWKRQGRVHLNGEGEGEKKRKRERHLLVVIQCSSSPCYTLPTCFYHLSPLSFEVAADLHLTSCNSNQKHRFEAQGET